MIGQKILLETIDKMTLDNLPRFIVITGAKGQGKRTLMCEIALKLEIPFVNFGIKIDEIREMIEMAYKQTEPIIYVIADADKMSIGAKNSLLKIIEEPPNNAYFIITLQNINNTLPTIKSRCLQLDMENYTDNELMEMIDKIVPNSSQLEKAILLDCCNNYHQIELLNKYGIEEFYRYIEKVVNNIYKVQSANSFKIAEKLDIKDDENGYDIDLFFNTFQNVCLDNALGIIDSTDEDLKQDYLNYLESNKITSKYRQKLRINRNK